MKTDGHLSRCYLKGRHGGAANAIPVGYNLGLVLAWLRIVLRAPSIHLRRAQIGFLADDYVILVSY
jgi:hypothetical protein